ncbi:MAG: V-type ATP synthase subunit D [Candidatus Micrarchaeota archaeon]|nr:V-type ATP synthase subunit D [Candidatus Micrarchaeota archaeon]
MSVKPTRSELINLKKKIKLAESGHKLLKKKRDGLIIEFFNVLKEAKNLRKELTDKYKHAHEKLLEGIALDGIVEVKTTSMALKDMPAIELETKNIMGVTVPKVKSGRIKKGFMERGYGLITTSMHIEEMASSYEELLEEVITTAEVETTLRKILSEIEKTKRRVNALEFSVIPGMKEQANFIKFRLEEMERENIFRMNLIKENTEDINDNM